LIGRNIILIIILLLLIIIPSLHYYDQYKKDVEINIDIDISTDKGTYVQDEPIIAYVKITNNLERTFPYDKYRFDFSMIEKTDYESGKKQNPNNWNEEAEEILGSLAISPGETVNIEVPYDMETEQKPGKYYMVFGIWRLEKYEKTGGTEFKNERFIKNDKTLIEVII
jgi:hypothetical protein